MNMTARLLSWAYGVVTSRPPDIVIGKTRFLNRWYIVPRNPLFNIYLHEWVGSDDDRALHDHPWWSFSWILGPHGLVEEYAKDHYITRRAILPGTRVWRSPTFRHRIIAARVPTYTLFITGPRVRVWGFWCPQGWRRHDEFDKNGCN